MFLEMGEESGEQCAVRVICRFRPLNGAETARGDQSLPKFPQDSEAVTFCGKTFTFDKVFPPQAKQAQIYDSVASRLVDDVIKGYLMTYPRNSCLSQTEWPWIYGGKLVFIWLKGLIGYEAVQVGA